ncbi:MAG: DUF2442 domain-containing protein [Cytophagales bacterium]|jgi:hypothetical protein|nr:DUF2442 domain-containing protein [Cytophagales bacterium]MCA6365613.1 DUF2442 domain-containing protein [Cytophagales bacterium]MCA6372556.1 DUF2442 domain-containing protein [Cytophagales bacterium]MCA6375564.1 DUF2442 domain-containing protein [Cytophagales bacterium]MCA6383165.1 DUF2442 domain-containing protein [Cytophagales bacterium]
MSILTISKSSNAVEVWFLNQQMIVRLDDGREISVPLNWFPKLRDATEQERNNWRLIGGGEGIRWHDIDEDILVEGLL